MKMIRPIFSLGVVSACVFAMPGTAALADVKAGVDAWSTGNYEGAIKEWKPAADRGDPDAMFNLAQAYKMGRGVPMDLTKAELLYGKAAAKGHVQAADTYGLLLFQRGERAKALPYIQAAAAHGDPRAQYILGVAHFNGDLVAKDWVRAYALVSLANQSGLPQAANALAQMDQNIPLPERQKGVALSSKIAADAQATRARQVAAAELGSPAAPVTSAPAAQPLNPARSPEIASAEQAVKEASRAADGPATAGADYARPRVNAAAPTQKASVASPSLPALAKATAPATKPDPQTVTAASGPWRVQLGAFGVASNADALWNRLKAQPALNGHAKLLVPAGKLTKLQAGGFVSKAAAETACRQLAASGFACLPATD